MPELPEVETVRRGLEKLILGKTIQSVEVKYLKMVQTDLAFRQDLPGQEIRAMGRRGKYLLFYLTDLVIISHLRMEGKYFFYPDEVPLRKHAHVFFHFTDGSTLVYEDVRKFGTMEVLIPELVDSYFLAKKIGPEPTYETFDEQIFREKLQKSTKKIKPFLLEQTLVAGLGNIYVDEVLWLAKIHPEKVANQLTESSIHLLHDSIIEILQKAIKLGGSSIRTYSALGSTGKMQDELGVYGKTGEKCVRCGNEIQKIKVAGRGTHFCPFCQQK